MRYEHAVETARVQRCVFYTHCHEPSVLKTQRGAKRIRLKQFPQPISGSGNISLSHYRVSVSLTLVALQRSGVMLESILDC
jgi:hypothetical protein